MCVAWTLAPPSVHERLPGGGSTRSREIARAVAGHRPGDAAYQAALGLPPLGTPPAPAFDWAALAPRRARPPAPWSPRTAVTVAPERGLPAAAGGLAGSPDEAGANGERSGLSGGPQGHLAGRDASGGRRPPRARAPVGAEARGASAARARASARGAALDGIYVQHMVAGSLELLVSAFRDPVFGAMVSCGAGGNLTELIDDVVLERAPVSEPLARDMLGRLRLVRHASRQDPPPSTSRRPRASSAVLRGWPRPRRGRGSSFEVNPIRVSEEGAAVDGLLVIDGP